MNPEERLKVEQYVRNQLAVAEKRLSSQTNDLNGQRLYQRSVGLVLKKYLNDFQSHGGDPRWIAVPGLRAVGKSTLLAQLYCDLVCPATHKLFASLDEANRVLGVSLQNILEIYEEVLGVSFEDLVDPVYIFLDEVQYDENWAITLKNLHDRARKVFIFCTGSSALAIKLNTDVSRRITFEPLYPLSFTDYMMFKHRTMPESGLGAALREALFQSEDAQEVYTKLLALRPRTMSYWSRLPQIELDSYLKYGTLPFFITFRVESRIYQQIEQTINSILTLDLPLIARLDQDTLNKVSQLLYEVGESSITSYSSLGKKLKLSATTVIQVLRVLEASEMLVRIYPQSATATQVKKPSKYTFLSPAYRASFFNLVGTSVPYIQYKGMLFEDAVVLALTRLFTGQRDVKLNYDPSEGGSDFILNLRAKRIPMEVGYGTKDFRQTAQTLKTYGGAYGLVVSSSNLEIDETKRMVKVPYSYFFLI